MKKIIFLLSFSLLISCGSSVKIIQPKYEEETTPKINELNSKEIGETLILDLKAFVYDAIKVTKGSKSSTYYIKSEITESNYVLKSQTKNHYLYQSDTFSTNGIAIPKNGGPEKIFIWETPNSVSTYDLKDKIEYKKTKVFEPKKNNFKREFIFNGKTSNNLKFTYREYVDDIARPAFTQDLQYDLNESNIIGFKGLRIEIVKATNTNIEYKVLNNFN